MFSKSVATLGNVEENDSVSRALARLAEVEEKVEALHEEQVGQAHGTELLIIQLYRAKYPRQCLPRTRGVLHEGVVCSIYRD